MDFDVFKNGLVVSCQAQFDHPLNDPNVMALLAECAKRGGAVGVRAEGFHNIREIKKRVGIPIIGIRKKHLYRDRFFITPTFQDAELIAQAGADMIALEATLENQPDTDKLGELIKRIQCELNLPVMADVSTYEEGMRAWALNADVVSTTLSGYTKSSQYDEKPNLTLVERLAQKGVKTVCEGNIRTQEHVKQAFQKGAHFCIVGKAITDPLAITSWFCQSIVTHQ